MSSAELIVDPETQTWTPFSEGIDLKLLNASSETGRWTIMLRCQAGSSFAKHQHFGAGEYYVIKGHMEYRTDVAKTGYYGYEPLGAVHELTEFIDYTELLFTNHGPIAFLDDEDNVIFLLDNSYLEKLTVDA
ncbi:cupin domain-containing protein [Sphingorhabdus sp. Alg231-15]|uniref:cupin domain-containing protein n=1 Tax=Sphingorhabdus sp. Alg231-15 TaxID=1922222 RepID=UPI000D55934B